MYYNESWFTHFLNLVCVYSLYILFNLIFVYQIFDLFIPFLNIMLSKWPDK
jgi:hypothetical protein